MNILGLILKMLYLCWYVSTCGASQVHDFKLMMESTTTTNQKKYCGRYLTEALATICEGNYQTMRPVHIHKKSYWKSQIYDSGNPYPLSDYPFQSRQQATSMVGIYGRKRRRRGVYNECCEKSCAIDQLRMYCAASSTSNPSK
ncbi:unnamed protein product [Ceutorhynchus assimilis]|uniref:Insulin-like domain-containing protein n=1 Tax=Ceutorhynchus assimilis TaxID=467358 RepID=A0A9N9MQJ9_9CUCU|nr:unnamed protein product [Ceutorhynchus assimilis]